MLQSILFINIISKCHDDYFLARFVIYKRVNEVINTDDLLFEYSTSNTLHLRKINIL